MRRPGFPVELRLEGRRVLVVGAEAGDKVRRVIECGAHVTIVSLAPPAEVPPSATWHARPFALADLDAADLVLFTTRGSPEADAVAAACRARRIPVWCHDHLPGCDFTMAALVDAGPLRVAVSSGGRAPALARAVRRVLERLFDAEFADWAASVARARDTDDAATRTARADRLRLEGRLRWDD